MWDNIDVEEFVKSLIDTILDNAEDENIAWKWGEETLRSVFSAIDYELSDLQSDVDSGQYSNQDIYDKIQEIRNKL